MLLLTPGRVSTAVVCPKQNDQISLVVCEIISSTSRG